MTMMSKTLTALTLLLPGLAFAHGQHMTASGLSQGLLHPLLGLDHLVVTLAVALWAARQQGSTRFGIPLAFAATLLVAAFLAGSTQALVGYEAGVILSLIIGLLLVIRNTQWSSWLALPLASAVAVSHGWAHGAESVAAASSALFLAGLAVTTVSLQLATMALHSRLAGFRLAAWSKQPE